MKDRNHMASGGRIKPERARKAAASQQLHSASDFERNRQQPRAATHLVHGLHAGLAVLNNPARHVSHVYVTGNVHPDVAAALQQRGLKPELKSPRDLDALLGGGSVHQGLAVQADPLAQPALDEFLSALTPGPANVAMLDQVTDPHNVGAVLRSAAAFGIDALIVQARHSPPVTGTLAKAASGGLEHVPVIETVNLARALSSLKDHGFQCIGFDSSAQRHLSEALGVERKALVFGAEDKGLRRLVREACDVICALPVPGPIKSLNISNAAAIAFYEAAKMRSS